MQGLKTGMEQTGQRLTQLDADLQAGAARRTEAEENLRGSRSALRRAKEDVTAANNTISGYALRQ